MTDTATQTASAIADTADRARKAFELVERVAPSPDVR